MRFDPSFNKHHIKSLSGDMLSFEAEDKIIDLNFLFGIFSSLEKFMLGYNLVSLLISNKLLDILKSLQMILSPLISSICFLF